MTEVKPKAPDDAGLMILVVADDLWIRHMVFDTLCDRGYRVIEAATGDEAIEVLSSSSARFHVVFSDIPVPGATNGVELARRVRTNRPGLPVLLTSGAVMSGEVCDHGTLRPKPYKTADDFDQIRCALQQRP